MTPEARRLLDATLSLGLTLMFGVCLTVALVLPENALAFRLAVLTGLVKVMDRLRPKEPDGEP